MQAKDITTEAIDAAIETARSNNPVVFSKRPDRQPRHEAIRVCYGWISAQSFRQTEGRHHSYVLKHRVEDWWGNYVSEQEYVVATELHGGSWKGKHVANKLVMPRRDRGEGLELAFNKHGRHVPLPEREPGEHHPFDTPSQSSAVRQEYAFIETDFGMAKFC